MRISLSWTCLAVIALSCGCGTKAAPVANQAPWAYRESQPASSPAFEYLPAEARYVIAARSAASLAGKLDRQGLIERHRGHYERAVAEVTQRIGHNLLDPQNLVEVGIAPDKALGMAWLGRGTGVLFAPIADHDRFQTALYRTASQLDVKLTPEVVGGSLIIAPRRSASWRVVIRGQTALLVITDQSNQHAADIAGAIAAMTPDRSLAAEPGFAAAMADLRFGEDLAGYLSADAILSPLFGTFDLGQDVSIAFGAELTPSAVRFKAFIPMDASEHVVNLLQNRPQPSALIGAAATHPTLVVSANVEPRTLLDMSIAKSAARLVAPLDIDLANDVIPLIQGEVGVMIERATQLNLADAPVDEALDVTVLAELADPAGAQTLLDRVMAGAALSGRARPAERANHYVLPDPNSKDWHIGIVGKHAVLSTSPTFADRLTGGGQTGLDSDIAALFQADTAALRLSVEALFPGLLMTPLRYDSMSIPVAGVGVAQPIVDPEKMSEDYRGKLQELEAARAELSRRETAIMAKQAQARLTTLQALGTSALRVEVGQGGLVIYGGQFFGKAGVAGGVDAVIALIIGDGEPSKADREAWDKAHDQVWRLERELRDIAARDRAQAEGAANRPAGPAIGPTVLGSLDKSAIQRSIRRKLPRIRYCYERELIKQPGLAATVRVNFVIDAQGAVSTATATGGPSRLNACIERIVKRIAFPKPTGGGVVKVSYPFTFKPQP